MADRQVIGFYDIGDENEYFSNWYEAPFELDGMRFFCIEQYMMYRKAEAFHDEKAMAAIMASHDQGEIKQIGRNVKNYDKHVWEGMRQMVVYRGLMAKFTQNPELLEALLDTGDAILAECSPSDEIWGIKRSLADERRFDPAQWGGTNLLGYALMEVREQLKQQ